MPGEITARDAGSMGVVIQQSLNRCAASNRIVIGGESAGMFSDEVMETITAMSWLVDQMMTVEVFEVMACRVDIDTIKGGCGISINIRTRLQSDSAEQTLLFRSKISIRKIKRSS